jgi:sulfur-carrier protein
MNILFFGRLQDSVGSRSLDLTVPQEVGDTDGLRAWLGAHHPDLLDPSVRIAVNARLAAANAPFDEGDEIAFLPPMSGG